MMATVLLMQPRIPEHMHVYIHEQTNTYMHICKSTTIIYLFILRYSPYKVNEVSIVYSSKCIV